VVHDLIVEATEGGLVGHDERVEPLHVRLCMVECRSDTMRDEGLEKGQ
jgi:hypothetical protein